MIKEVIQNIVLKTMRRKQAPKISIVLMIKSEAFKNIKNAMRVWEMHSLRQMPWAPIPLSLQHPVFLGEPPVLLGMVLPSIPVC